jgi:autotransporter-associated beta strand protein
MNSACNFYVGHTTDSTGTMILNDSSTFNNNGGWTVIGGGASVNGGTGRLDVNDSAVVNAANQPFYVGYQLGNGTLNLNTSVAGITTLDAGGLQIANSEKAGPTSGIVTMNGYSKINVNYTNVGCWGDGDATLNINDNAKFVNTGTGGSMVIGNLGSTGTVNMTGSASIDSQSSNPLDMGSGTGSSGVLKMSGGSHVEVSGWLNVGHNGGQASIEMKGTSSIHVAQFFNLGCYQGASGTLDMYDTSAITIEGTDNTRIGFGDLVGAVPTAVITLNNDSRFTCNGNYLMFGVGDWWDTATAGKATVNLNGTSRMLANNVVDVQIGGRSSGEGIFNLKDSADFTSTAVVHAGFISGTATIDMQNKSTMHLACAQFGGGDYGAGTANITMSGSSSIQLTDYLILGTAGGNSSLGMSGSSSIVCNNYLGIGTWDGVGSLTLGAVGGSDTTSVVVNGPFAIGYKGTGSLVLNGNSTFTGGVVSGPIEDDGSDNSSIGLNWGTSGAVRLNDHSTMTTTGNVIIGGWREAGSLTVSGNAKLVSHGTIAVGLNDGSVTTPADSPGTVTVNGAGAIVTSDQIVIGACGNQGSVWNQVVGHTTVATPLILGQVDYVDFAPDNPPATGIGTLQLNGGTFTAPAIKTQSSINHTTYDSSVPPVPKITAVNGVAQGIVNFNGGILQASTDSSDFINVDTAAFGGTMTLNVQAGSAKIDTQGYNVTITQVLLEDAASKGGGLKKLGSGVLTLTASPTYHGDTTVDAGTLNVPVLNTPNATVYVATDAKLNASSIVAGTLTIGGPAKVANAVPEPSAMLLLVLAGLALAGASLRRK